MEWQTLSYKPLYILLADHLEVRIRNGDFPTDSFLPPFRDLMRIFNVSLATVRKALERLEEQELIKRRQGSGVLVIFANPDKPASGTGTIDIETDIRDLFALRALLEPAALEAGFDLIDRKQLTPYIRAKDPISREDIYAMDEAMHTAVLETCPNRHLQRMLSDVMRQIELYREVKFRNIDTSDGEDFSHVQQIIHALRDDQCDKAVEALKSHINGTRDIMLALAGNANKKEAI